MTPVTPPSEPIKVAVIEDDKDIRFLYQFKLEAAGYNVAAAVNGQEGLTLAKDFRPNLILLDLRMPVMGGEQMLKQLRETEWGADMRVIILTNISRDEAPRSLAMLGVDRYAVKAQHTPAQIVAIVNEVLSR